MRVLHPIEKSQQKKCKDCNLLHRHFVAYHIQVGQQTNTMFLQLLKSMGDDHVLTTPDFRDSTGQLHACETPNIMWIGQDLDNSKGLVIASDGLWEGVENKAEVTKLLFYPEHEQGHLRGGRQPITQKEGADAKHAYVEGMGSRLTALCDKARTQNDNDDLTALVIMPRSPDFNPLHSKQRGPTGTWTDYASQYKEYATSYAARYRDYASQYAHEYAVKAKDTVPGYKYLNDAVLVRAPSMPLEYILLSVAAALFLFAAVCLLCIRKCLFIGVA